MLGDNLLKLVEPDREDNRVRLRDRLAYGCGGSQRAELRGELQGLMWLGFALTEAVVFYGLLGGLLAFVLVK